ncbi:putative tetratricopeptide-like helical domain-containing protein [Rosa chinensis]|uniref:Putative tetratricopeptide-like helical domain-containing protein n=1 Tax=Rosa chinensis TaxID=74649 RepID=A0A2P6Q3I2_ROSCH|nr:putative tetratricopeptide-like helical domain-containing protein [Rosa chinensis]
MIKLPKSSRLWTLYVDLDESFGTLGSSRAVYERILDLRIATTQIIINYASLLEEHKYFEDAFKVNEKGTQIQMFKYGGTQMERARALFEDAVKVAPSDAIKPLYLQFAKLEEDYGLAKRAMNVYHEAIEAVPKHDKLSLYESISPA